MPPGRGAPTLGTGHPVPMLIHPLHQAILPNVQSKPPLSQLWTVPVFLMNANSLSSKQAIGSEEKTYTL